MSAPITISGREIPPLDDTTRENLIRRYYNVFKIGGTVCIEEAQEVRIKNSSKTYYEVDVTLSLPGNAHSDNSLLCVGTGKDDKDMKGAYKDLLSKLGVVIPKTLNMDDEKAFRELAYSDMIAKYNMFYSSSADLCDSVKHGKATVELWVRNRSVVARGTGRTEEEAYNNILKT